MQKGTIIYRTDSPLGPITVSENRKTRWIAFDNEYVQTIIDKVKPYRPLLLYLPAMCCVLEEQQNSVLLLGTGGGSLLHYLAYFHPKSQVDAIDISRDMIHIAQTFFDIHQPITEACAYDFIKTCEPKDHIMLDLLTGPNIPIALTEGNFFEHCKNKSNKTVTFNIITKHIDQRNRLLNTIRRTFESRTLCLPVKNKMNLVVHAYKNKDFIKHIEKLVITKRIVAPIWHEHYGALSKLIQ